MCLYLNQNSEIKVAKKPIHVYKVVYDVEIDGKTYWSSPYYTSCKNIYGETKIPVQPNFDSEYLSGSYNLYDRVDHLVISSHEDAYTKGSINTGIHGYITPPNIVWGFPNCLGRTYKVADAIIPRGAEYCIGRDNEIVATRMIVCKDKKHFRKLFVKNLLSFNKTK